MLDVLLQLLDDGRLTDGQGRTVNFRNTLIIMTSNLRDNEALKGAFRPEFINRIDEIIIFKSLGVEEIKKIVDVQLNILKKRLEERKITLEVSDKAKEYLANIGYDPVYGARPLKRVIQKNIQDPLSLIVLRAELKELETVKAALESETKGLKKNQLLTEKSETNIDKKIVFVKI